MKIKVVLLIIW